MATSKKSEAGGEIESKCLKCKDVTNHTIVAMDGDTVVKVVCNVCKARHNYRPPTPKKKTNAKKKPAKKAAPKPSKEAKAAAHFEEMTQDLDHSKARPYAMNSTFGKGDLLKHQTFGLGLVTATAQPNRIEVLFKEYSKILICEIT